MQKVVVRMALLELAAVFGFGFMLGMHYEASKYDVVEDEPVEAVKKKRTIKLEDGKLIFDIANWR